RSPSREPNGTFASEPLAIEFAAVCNEVARDAATSADLAQPVRVRAVGCANYEDEINDLAQLAHRSLAVLRRIADVARLRADNVRKAFLECDDGCSRIVDTERRLRDVG